MTWEEAAAFLRGREREEQKEWEMIRRIAWAAIAPHTRKRLQPEDVIKFPWDKDYVDTTEVDEKELERIRELAKKIKL